MNIYARMKDLGLVLPEPPARGGLYTPAKRFGRGLVYVSGCGPVIDDNPVKGKLGEDFTVDEGMEYSRRCMMNVLSVLESSIGDLNKVRNAVKILTFVAGTSDFYDQPLVANGGSKLLIDLFGEDIGAPSRSAIGVNALPGNIPVETEALFEIEE